MKTILFGLIISLILIGTSVYIQNYADHTLYTYKVKVVYVDDKIEYFVHKTYNDSYGYEDIFNPSEGCCYTLHVCGVKKTKIISKTEKIVKGKEVFN